MRSSTFRNVTLGILALAAAYHLGARSAVAQASDNPVVAGFDSPASGYVVALTANGDVYRSNSYAVNWSFSGNIFGAPTPATPATLGEIKSRYR
jgi:hypothetical protein